MFIGAFCKLTDTTPKTIRYYESLGLLPEAKRQGNYRVYDETYVETVRQIKLAQSFGFSLAELKGLCEGEDIRRGMPAHVIFKAIAEKRAGLKAQIQILEDQEKGLAELEAELSKNPCG